MYNTPGIQNTVLMPIDEFECQSDFPYASLCGKLRYLTITRPDIEFALNQCCRFQSSPSQVHVDALLQYLKKNNNLPLKFIQIVWDNIIVIIAYMDAGFVDNVPGR